MTDDFIRGLQQDWRSQDHGADRLLRDLNRRRWTPHLILALEILGCLGALLVGIWFAWIAMRNKDQALLFALSAAVLLVAAPALCIASVRARRSSLKWSSETPEDLLRMGVRRAEASLRAIRIGRWHLAILAAFIAVLWAAEALNFIHAIEFLILYTAICLVALLLSWIWMIWREKRARSERDACAKLLAMIQAGDENP